MGKEVYCIYERDYSQRPLEEARTERESKLNMASRPGMTNRSRVQSREEQSRKESTGEQRERRRGTERS